MQTVFKKLNLKDGEQPLILNAPDSFLPNIKELEENHLPIFDVDQVDQISFAIVFIFQQEELKARFESIQEKLKGDVSLWFAYPKKSSKKYKSNISRDSGWELLGEHQFEPVRMVAIDENWSALRFRKVQYIKNLTRNKDMRLTKKRRS